MKIILDNIIFSLQIAGGISMVWSNLINNLEKEDLDTLYIEYPNSENNLYRKALKISNNKINNVKCFDKILTQLNSVKLKYNQKFIFHSSYFRICNNPNAINISTVHDFIYEQSKMTLKQKFRRQLDYKAIRKSDAIICVSDNTKNDLLKFLPDINPRKVFVIYNGVSDEYYKLKEIPYPIYSKYLLFVGNRIGYKNFDKTISFIKYSKYNLLIVGGSLSTSELNLLNKEIPGKFKVLTHISNNELNKIYNSVFGLVYPSEYEGFGLPVLEAQRAGCPVIAQNKSSIPEIIGKNYPMMNDCSINSFKELLSIIENSRESLIEQGISNAQRFSWGKMAKEYIDVYNSLLNNK